MPKYSTKIP